MTGELIVYPSVALRMIELELDHARTRFGPFASPHEGIAVVREEYIELERDVFGNRGRELVGVAEAVQLAAMATRYVVDLGGHAGVALAEHVNAFGTVRGAAG